jgi:hypothetical protein
MKRILSHALDWLKARWRWLLTVIIISALAVFTLSFQLNSLVPGQNRFETTTLSNIQQFPNPFHRSVNAPYFITAYTIGKVTGNPLYAARITSVIFALLAAACFFYLVKLWFNWRIATIGTLLFISGSWMLNFSHQAAPITILIFAPLLALVTFSWATKTTRHRELAFMCFAISLALAAYVPYTPWVIAIALIIFIIKERHFLKNLPVWLIGSSAAIYLILLGPLFVSLANHPGQIRELLGIPMTLPSFEIYLSQLANQVSAIVIRSQPLPEIHLGKLPILDIFSATMFALGLYYFARRLPKTRSLILIGCLVLLILILPISNEYQLNSAILLPLIYICVITGIVTMLKYWYEYFPRNPLARNIGVVLIVIAIGFSCYYNLQYYFIAWPNSADTQAVYMVKSKDTIPIQ